MKKQLFKHPMLFLVFACALLAGTTLQAQTYHTDDKADLRAFLRQPSATPADPTTNNRWNGGRLGLTPADTANWQTNEAWVTQVVGLTWNDDSPKRLTRIGDNSSWSFIELAGSLTLPGCTALTELDCSYNQLTALDVSKNTALTLLACSGNQLTALDVGKNTALTELYCSYNQLTVLDVSNNTALTELYCFENQLTALDMSKNTALTNLDCSGNQLTALDVSKNTTLTGLGCSENQLTALDVSKNMALTQLSCNGNELTTLDVSKNTALTFLQCNNNQLPLSDLYLISQKINEEYNKCLGLQQPVHFTDTTLVAGSPLDFSTQSEFGGIKTVFAVNKDDNDAQVNTDYSIANGVITFLTTGAYTVEMTNTAITSAEYYPAEAITGTITVAETVYTITASVNGAGGSISPKGMVPVAENGDKTFIFTPDNGYAIDQVLVNNVNNAEAAASGAYTFRNVTANQSIAVSFKLSMGIDGPEKENNGLSVYPNPVTNGALTIRIGAYTSSSKEVIAVYNISGKLMGTYPIVGSETIIDISHLPAGIYLVQAGGKRVKVMKN